MAKAKTLFVCQSCAAQFPQWAGQCHNCNAWNSLVEQRGTPANSGHPQSRLAGFAGEQTPAVTTLEQVTLTAIERQCTGFSELNRVLGGGLVPGSVTLLGGDPGIGKSTLLLQMLTHLSQRQTVLYITGEESLQQIGLRAQRLGLMADNIQLLAATQLDVILAQASTLKPDVIVLDSIQTVYTAQLSSAPGSVSQVRECAAQCVQLAKQSGCALFLVGHVTKEGALAGPRILEHMVDTVLYFEGQSDNRLRMIRAVKNRFGAANELGVFAMTDKGLREVANPSAIFLSRDMAQAAGSLVMATWEGSRPLLVEVQALVDESPLANPRRVTVGLEHNRLAMLLAVLHRHGGIATFSQDVFVNVVGGVRVMETAADLAVLLAIVSSLTDRPLPPDLVVFGEVGLAGEIRPISNGLERLNEAAKHGFRQAIVPAGNMSKAVTDKLAVTPVKHISQAIQWLRDPAAALA
jgi:DNA repair protein RadA/Sms